MFKKSVLAAALSVGLIPLGAMSTAQAADYVIDSEGQHAFVQFRINHLGYSYILGNFPSFTGEFQYDPENLDASAVSVEVDTTSLTSHHAERDKHIKSGDFLDVSAHPTATFVSTSFTPEGDGAGVMVGDLTLHGETHEIEMPVSLIGEGEDPWGGYRAGFEGQVTLSLEDYGIDMSSFPAPMRELELYVTFEGVKQ
ncbi:YceI family protein [Halomonas halocynthiae]|uniref:YceI family protein n=1 Tax=Halomonas halocynthiae TaxID=176290 RepID=UPI00040C0CC1|nr:YceI family protein [Halomonas halocynthiae]